jgi:hypothetical protein
MIDAPEEVLHPGTRALFRYWESMRGEESAPSRRRLDLDSIRPLVPSLFILERRPVKGYVWRLAGTKLCQLWRRELTGTAVLAGWDAFERHTTERLLDGVVLWHQPFVLKLRLFSSLGHDIGAEMIGLPLRSLNGKDIHVFGAIMPFRDAEPLGYDSIGVIELATARVIWTEPLPFSGVDSLESRKAEGISPSKPLRIIAGGRPD